MPSGIDLPRAAEEVARLRCTLVALHTQVAPLVSLPRKAGEGWGGGTVRGKPQLPPDACGIDLPRVAEEVTRLRYARAGRIARTGRATHLPPPQRGGGPGWGRCSRQPPAPTRCLTASTSPARRSRSLVCAPHARAALHAQGAPLISLPRIAGEGRGGGAVRDKPQPPPDAYGIDLRRAAEKVTRLRYARAGRIARTGRAAPLPPPQRGGGPGWGRCSRQPPAPTRCLRH